MMKELNIRIKIADKEYSLRAQPKDEALLRAAAKTVNEKLKSRKEQFGLQGRQDLLSMIAFDTAVESLRTQELEQDAIRRLGALNERLRLALAESAESQPTR